MILAPGVIGTHGLTPRRKSTNPQSMENLNVVNVVVALITRDNDYQAEQAASATDAAARLGAKVQIIYADNDAVNQTQQLVKIIQDPIHRPAAILVEPVGTGMPQIAKAAVAAGIGWGILSRQADYIAELRRGNQAPVFSVTTDQEEVGRLQGKELAALAADGNILYIEGPSNSSVSTLRRKGLLTTKPAGVAMKTLKGDWTERSAHQAVKSWLSLSTSRQLHIRAVVCQNDAMAMGARKAFVDLTEQDREQWLKTPFIGCDGVTKTGQEWVRCGYLTATVITPPTAGMALEILVKAIRTGAAPPENTLSVARALPALEELAKRRVESAPAAAGRA
jgi:ABC-type sugar transport system substrate-binding protein